MKRLLISLWTIIGISVSIIAQEMVIEKTDKTTIRINVDEIQRAYFDFENNNDNDDIGNVQKWSDFNFLFFSDVHGNANNVTNILKYAESLEANIDCVINGGDIVGSTMSEGLEWYNDLVENCSVPVLAVPGNHDCWNSTGWDWADGVSIYNLITKEVAETVPSIVQPSNAATKGLNYYYKDFGNIRVICLTAISNYYYDSEQDTWLRGVLESARTTYHYYKIVSRRPKAYTFVEGDVVTAILENDAVLGDTSYNNASYEGNIYAVPMSVIIVNHCPFTPSVADRVPSNRLNSWFDYTKGDKGFNKNIIYDGLALSDGVDVAVNDYIAKGGSFICYLTGHTHADNILTHKIYNSQFMINITTANGLRHTDSAAATSKYDPNYDCFDHIGIDLRSGMIKVLRVGLAQDSAMRTRRSWCYDFVNQVLLSENN